MVKLSDVGSMPLKGQREEFLKGVNRSQSLTQYIGYGEGFGYVKAFEDIVVSGTVDKIKAGIDVPTYPQYRDMNEMFLDMIKGLTKTRKGYFALEKLTIEPGKMIPEVYAVKSHMGEVSKATGVGNMRLKICVTGPYTLSTLFSTRTPELFTVLGRLLIEVTSNSIFKLNQGETALVSLYEPAFGLMDDPMLDIGQPGRECLRKAWENITYAAKSRGVETMIHLHSTADPLMWSVQSLDLISSHVSDPLYSVSTKRLLAETGKRLYASVAVSSYDDLIAKVTSDPEKSAAIWNDIRLGRLDPTTLLEDEATIRARLGEMVDLFGSENLPYAGLECGLGGHPTYSCALAYLSRVSEAVKKGKDES